MAQSTVLRWLHFLIRAVGAGAGAGIVAAMLIYFVFGFVGLAGGDLVSQARNGWRAAVALGAPRGFVHGLGIAAGLAAVCIVWVNVAPFSPRRARLWLALAAAAAILAGNAGALERYRDFDPVGVATVLFMSGIGAGAVWVVAPWVMRPLDASAGSRA